MEENREFDSANSRVERQDETSRVLPDDNALIQRRCFSRDDSPRVLTSEF